MATNCVQNVLALFKTSKQLSVLILQSAFSSPKDQRETAWQHSRDILLGSVELLLQVARRRLAGDLDHGQLLVVARHVARVPAHAAAALHRRKSGCRGTTGKLMSDLKHL